MHLHTVGGTEDPGGDRGVRGPGAFPKDAYASLLVAFNGGFKGPHGGFGMVANKFMDSMAVSASGFPGTRERDFFYVVLDESRYR